MAGLLDREVDVGEHGVDVMAEEPTEINAGGVVLGSKGTQYAVRLRRSESGPVCEGVVYENDLLIRTTQKEIPLSTSRSWVFNFATGTGEQAGISEQVLGHRFLPPGVASLAG